MSKSEIERVSRAANARNQGRITVTRDDTYSRREVRDTAFCGLILGLAIGVFLGYAWAYTVTANPKFAEYARQHQTAGRDPLLEAR